MTKPEQKCCKECYGTNIVNGDHACIDPSCPCHQPAEVCGVNRPQGSAGPEFCPNKKPCPDHPTVQDRINARYPNGAPALDAPPKEGERVCDTGFERPHKLFQFKEVYGQECAVVGCSKPRIYVSKGNGRVKQKRLCRSHMKALKRFRADRAIREGAQNRAPKEAPPSGGVPQPDHEARGEARHR